MNRHISIILSFANFTNARHDTIICVHLVALICAICWPCLGETQERTAAPPYRGNTLTKHVADDVHQTVADFNAELGPPCGTHIQGEEWSDTCPAGLRAPDGSPGRVVNVCLLGGVTAMKDSNCVAPPRDCDGGHAHGTTWQTNCAAPLSGSVTYQCTDGNISVAKVTCSASYQCLDGSSYTGLCPTGTEGSVTYTCSNNTLSPVANTCATVNAGCGEHPHGSR